MKSFVVFVVGGLIFGASALGTGFGVWGEDALLQGGVAFALTFVPAVGTLAWALRSYRTSPDMQLLACLGSSGVRMAIALGGGYFLRQTQPDTFTFALLLWLLVFYLTFLAAEITLVVRLQPAAEPTAQR